jgi:hypothetical protein
MVTNVKTSYVTFHNSPSVGRFCQEQTAAKLTRSVCFQPARTDPGIKSVFYATGQTWREIKSEIDFLITDASGE